MKRSGKFILCFLLLPLLAACGDGGGSASDNSEAELFKPSLTVDLQIEGNTATVHVNTNMSISEEHYGQARKSGEGHSHMYLDNGEKIGVKGPVQVFENLSSGTHILKVSLHNNDHTPYDVTQTIEFDIP